MITFKKFAISSVQLIAFTLAILATIYARHGYVFGASDQSETLPYMLWLNNHGLYPTDFYLQNIIQHPFNERRFFVEMLRVVETLHATSLLKYCVFFLHALCTASLLWGIWFYMRERYGVSDEPLEVPDELTTPSVITPNTKSEVWIAILVPLLFLYNINTGAVELYENTFNPSYLANILAIWVFILHDYRKTFWAAVLISFITFIQPLIGASLALIFFLSETTLQYMMSRRGKNPDEIKRLIWCFLFYACTAGVYLIALSHQVSSPTDSSLSMQIIGMRASHHYFPGQFPIVGYILMLAYIVAIVKYGSMNEHFWTFFIVIGCIVYSVGVYFFESNFILNTQFFRMTIWIKLWGSMALVRWFFTYLETDKPMQFIEKHFKKIVLSIGVICTFIMLPSFRVFKNKDYMFPFFKNTNAVVEISEHAKTSTPTNALFITPPDFEAFRFYSERSNFIDYKAILHDNTYLLEWQKRIKLIYNVGIANKEKGFQLIPIAKVNYNTLSDSALVMLCQENHVGFVIRDTAFAVGEGFMKVDSTKRYGIYKILERND